MRVVEFNPLTGNRLFGGESSQERASKGLHSDIRRFGTELGGANVTATNRFNNYQSPFDYKAKSNVLSDLYKGYQTDINREAASESANVARGTAARLGSQGLTGGSIFNNQIMSGQNQVDKNKFRSLSDLKSARLGLETGIMNQENQDKFNITGAAQNVDFQNIMNQLRKYGLIQSNFGLEGQAVKGLSDDTLFDDILALAETASKFMPKPTPGG
jgi:hypothetical protein